MFKQKNSNQISNQKFNHQNPEIHFLSKFARFLSCVTLTAIANPAGVIAQTATASSSIFNIKGELVGTATFIQTPLGVKVSLKVQNLTEGEHMVHLHKNGKCDPPNFKTSGDHFDPKDEDIQGHHLHSKHEAGKHEESNHKPAGDLPNIIVQKNGNGSLAALLSELTLGSGKNSLLKQGGTSIIIHAGANGKSTIPNLDYKTRIACGVIKP